MPHSIYIHIPFCTHRCAYCDFNTYADQERLLPAYVSALINEIRSVGATATDAIDVHTVFFGGGTPSLLSSKQVSDILGAIEHSFDVSGLVEVTLEANPGVIESSTLGDLRTRGVNRLSLGVQSANGEELRQLERLHSFGDVLAAVSAARQAGFENLNVDLLFGLPGQSMEVWQTTVHRVLQFRPEHISAYALTLEHGTPFGHWATWGLMPEPDPDMAAAMYEWLAVTLEEHGFRQYEISNWAMDGRQCLHNLQYWKAKPYLGFGAGAHGYAAGQRYSNVLGIAAYIERLRNEPIASNAPLGFPLSPAAVDVHRQTPQDEMTDYMITGLRLTDSGVSASQFESRLGTNLWRTYGKQIRRLEAAGLLEITGAAYTHGGAEDGSVRLSQRGRLLGNRVFREFVAA